MPTVIDLIWEEGNCKLTVEGTFTDCAEFAYEILTTIFSGQASWRIENSLYERNKNHITVGRMHLWARLSRLEEGVVF